MKPFKKKVQQDKDLALGLKVQGAPTIYVNGNLVDSSYDGIKKMQLKKSIEEVTGTSSAEKVFYSRVYKRSLGYLSKGLFL
ncbi:hypothetical protein GCM10020331_088770 [Ectobacillus funiculus]